MLDYSTYPNPNMVEGLKNYIEHRIPPGGFLLAVLTNDLKGTFARADDVNRDLIFETVSWLYNEFPSNAWGSIENVKSWLHTVTAEDAA